MAWDDLGLEPTQRDLLARMVEADRRVTPQEARSFIFIQTYGGSELLHRHFSGPVDKLDLDELVAAGLLRPSMGSRGSSSYTVTNHGRTYYAAMKTAEGEAAEHVEAEVRHFLDSELFRKRHPTAYARWSEAEAAVWDAEDESALTQLGHVCREAMILFAADLIGDDPSPGLSDASRTVDRLRAALVERGLSEAVSQMGGALVAYWGTVSDLVVRQEHGATKEREPLTWEDGRRCVFMTGLVMFEIDHALQ
jgi:hypothetical protein